MEGAGLLRKGVPFGTEVLLLVKGGLYHKLHVGVNGQSIGSGGIPLERGTERLGVLKGERTVLTKVGPGVLIGLGRNGERRIVCFKELDGVVGGSRVGDTDRVRYLQGGLNGPADNPGLVLDHEEDDDLPWFWFWLYWLYNLICMDNRNNSVCHNTIVKNMGSV